MKHIGKTLKEHIESNKLVKGDIAKQAGISYNYLSTIFKQESIDAKLLEKLCIASGLHPSVVFEVPQEIDTIYKDIWAKTLMGHATVEINSNENLRALLNEKERVINEKERIIQILMSKECIAESGQKRDNDDK